MSGDLRQGVTPTQHAVLDDVARGQPSWQMMSVNELEQRFELAFLDPPAAGIDWRRLAALALHLAERAARPAHAEPVEAPITDPAAAGYISLYAADEYWGTTADDLRPIIDALDNAEAAWLPPVLKVDAFHAPDLLFAVQVPTAFAEDGTVAASRLEFHPTHQSALSARLRAPGEDAV